MSKLRKWLRGGFLAPEGAEPKKKSKLIEKETSIIKVIYETKGLWDSIVHQTDDIAFENIEIPNIGQSLEPGAPSLPQEGLYIAIPEGATITDIKVVSTKQKTFAITQPVKPGPTPTTDKSAPPEFIPKKEIYEQNVTFPGELYKNLGTQKMGDITVLHLMMYPVQYNPVANTIILYKKIELDVSYKSAERRLRGAPTRGAKKRVPAGYEDQILNFDNI